MGLGAQKIEPDTALTLIENAISNINNDNNNNKNYRIAQAVAI